MQRFSGISKRSKIRTTKNGLLQTEVHSAAKQLARRRKDAEHRASLIKGLSSEDRAVVQDMDAQMPPDDHQDLYEAAYNTMPPGEEGFDLSHEGGEHEAFEEFVHNITGVKYVDHRTRRDRVELRNTQWRDQYEDLVDAYLVYSQREQDGLVTEDMELEGEGTVFEIETVDIFGRAVRRFVPDAGDTHANAVLVRQGYIGASPIRPTMAISIRTLAVYRQTHRVCPRLTIQAEVRKLCHLHKVPYRRYLCEQFSIAYDVYLEVLYRVDARVRAAMKQDSRDAQLLNACPACTYKLEDEPDLKFSLLCEMDGNNSLKRLDAAVRERVDRTDSRQPRGPFWVSREYVDQFKDEVKRSPGNTKDDAEDGSEDHDAEDDWEDEPGSDDPVATCIERWRNAGPEQRKRMFALFEESGLFIIACRHGVVLLVCDMVRSGELAKYGLALVDRAIDVYGPKICVGYDIGCAMEGTVGRSSLATKVKESELRFVVGAFHGHAHNRGCQLRWHPLYVTGTGRSDFEGCERVFSASNAVAAGTRHASRFHRHQAIDEHLMFWNIDKYALLSNFIVNHYREALRIVQEHPVEIRQMQATLGVSDTDCHAYIQQEGDYLSNLKREPPEETLRFQYLEALEDLEKKRAALDAARKHQKYLTTTPALPNLHKSLVSAARVIRSAEIKFENAETTATQLEASLQLPVRWSEKNPEYIEMKQKLRERKYRKALDELERLVVQRLFELAKLQMSGTGYKLRQQISKALQRRSTAIQNALKKHNTLARSLTPPGPELSWTDIVEYSFLGEFELLRHSRVDIRQAAWAQPSHRELTLKVLQLERAKEELVRLGVEVRRLRTFIHDETKAMTACLATLDESNPALAAEVRKQWRLRSSVNAVHIARLDRLASSPNVMLPTSIGCRVGSSTEPGSVLQGVPDHQVLSEVLEGDDQERDIQHDEELSQEVERMTEFVQAIPQ